MQAWKDKYASYVNKQQEASLPETARSLLTGNLRADLQELLAQLGDNGDLVVRDFRLFGTHQAAMIFFSSLVNMEQVREHVLKPLMAQPSGPPGIPEPMSDMIHYIWSTAVQVTQGTTTADFASLTGAAVKGELILLIEGVPEALRMEMRQIDLRGVEQPQTEQVIRGPREGYVEKLENNLSLLRYRLQSTDFRIEISPLGTRTQSRVALCYIESIADTGIVAEAMRRISMIDTDGILDAGYIEQFIEDQPLSPFPQVQSTERPDKTVAALLKDG